MDQNQVYQTPQPQTQIFPNPDSLGPPSTSNPLASVPVRKSPFPKIFLLLFIVLVVGLAVAAVWWFNMGNQFLPLNNVPDNLSAVSEQPTPVATPALLNSPAPTLFSSPETSPLINFSFYDASVWLNPDLVWQKVPANDMRLSSQAVFVEGPQIPFTALPLQGTEWKATQNLQDSAPQFHESSQATKQRLAALGWLDTLESEDYVFTPNNNQSGNGNYSYIRLKQGQLQTLISITQEEPNASDSAQSRIAEQRIFLSDPINISDLIQKYRK